MSLYKRGNPDGTRNLELPQPHYERQYAIHLHKKIGTWHPWQKQGTKALSYAAMMLASVPPIIDIGCGPGHLAAMYAAFGRKDEYALGMDYCPSAIRMATEKHAPWANIVCGNVTGHKELLRRNIYRTAVMIEVLEHIFEDRELLASVPVGRTIVASVPDFPLKNGGHVRWFGNELEVRQRYGHLVAFDRVIVDHGVQSDNRWFIFKGRRI